MTPQDVLRTIGTAVAIVLEVPAASVTPALDLAADLGADSLAVVEIVDIVEEQLAAQSPGFVIDDEDVDDLASVQDLLDYCLARLAR